VPVRWAGQGPATLSARRTSIPYRPSCEVVIERADRGTHRLDSDASGARSAGAIHACGRALALAQLDGVVGGEAFARLGYLNRRHDRRASTELTILAGELL